jgi:hypothetical protein
MVYLLLIVGTSLAVSEQYFLIPLAAIAYYRRYILAWLYLAAATYYIMFVSFNNTSKYFDLKDMGIGLDYEWYYMGAAQVQFLLVLLIGQILLSIRNTKS